MQAVLLPLLRLIDIEARCVVRSSDFRRKLEFGRMLTEDIRRADALIGRIAYLGEKADVVAGRRAAAAGPAFRVDRARFHLSSTEILTLVREALPSIHRTWDGPTHEILAELASAQEARLAGKNDAAEWPPDEEAGAPLRPARGAVFDHPSAPPGWEEQSSLVRTAVEVLHFLLVQTEIPTIELCCSIIHDFPDCPWGLSVDLAQQIADEIRHAQSCLDRLDELGGRLGQFPADLRIWHMTSPQSVELRLAIHQRIGEWIGVDALSWWADVLIGRGDERTGAMFKFMCADEVNHVALGVRWLRLLTGSDVAVRDLHRQAERIRLQAGEHISSHGRYPFNEWACRQAGLTEEEVAHFRALAQSAAGLSGPPNLPTGSEA